MDSTKIKVEIRATTSTKIEIPLDYINPNSYISGSITVKKTRAEFKDYYYDFFNQNNYGIQNTYIKNTTFRLSSNDWYSGSVIGISGSTTLRQYDANYHPVDAPDNYTPPPPINAWYYDVTDIDWAVSDSGPWPNFRPWGNIFLTGRFSSSSGDDSPIKRMSAISSINGNNINTTHQFSISFTEINGEAVIPGDTEWVPPIKDPILPPPTPVDPPYYTQKVSLPDGTTETISTYLNPEFMNTPSKTVETMGSFGELYPIEVEYGVQLGWYTSSNKYLYKTIISQQGATSPDTYNEGIPQEITSKEITYNFIPSETFPGAISGCPVRVYVYATQFDTPQSAIILSNPYVRATNIIMGTGNDIVTSGSMGDWGMKPFEMRMPTKMYFSSPPTATTSACAIEYIPMSTTSFSDVDGKTGSISGSTSLTLTFGRESDESEWVTWIPYLLDTGNSVFNYGTHIVSACIVATSASDKAYIPGEMFSVSSGVQNGFSPAQPKSWNDLKGLTIRNQKSEPIVESWESGREYYIDLTDSMKALIEQNNAIWLWSGWNRIGVVLKDNASTVNNIRTIFSGESNIYGESGKPRLILDVARNSYNRQTMGTTIIEKVPSDRSYRYSGTGAISGSSSPSGRRRSLLWFNLQGAPTATSAYIVLRLKKGATPTTLNLHRVNQDSAWDWHSACWNARTGTRGWGTAGGSYIATVYGSTVISPSMVGDDYSLSIPITNVSGLNEMINNPAINNGFIIKLSNESTTGDVNYYSQNLGGVDNLWARPKLVINNTHTIQETGEPEGGGGGGMPTPPQTPPPTTVGQVKLEKERFVELAKTSNPTYTMDLTQTANRYILISEGFHGDLGSAPVSRITKITVAGVNMTKLAASTPEIINRANAAMWGAVIPNGVSSAVFGFTREGDVGSNGAISKIFIRQFSNVNPTAPIATGGIFAGRSTASSSKTTSGYTTAVNYVAKGYVADGVYLSNGREALGKPYPTGGGQQIARYQSFEYCFSDFVPPVNASGTILLNWDWKADKRSEYASEGSPSAHCVISLNPD